MSFIDEIPDLFRDFRFALFVIEDLSKSEQKNLIKEELFDDLNSMRDDLFKFLGKWDLTKFKKEYYAENHEGE